MKKLAQYIPFARKYRPASFSELRGQEALTKILTYAILNNRLAQGYLLTGIRGVGKTTSARIIANTINCENVVISENNISPCTKCQNCTSFSQHKHPDIIEMDAASKTSVDDIRVIIESSEYRPLLGKYKLFIIDEVHMLSKNAFNALLKVLEEPPPHVIFIFATTEVQKIPLTVISRCQRYDLRRFTFNEILQLITEIAQKENLQLEDEALQLIALKSEGSAREATAMLDQAVSLGSLTLDNNIITAAMIGQMLGAVDTATIIQFLQYVVDRDSTNAIAVLNKIYLASANLENFVESVSDFTAYLSKAKMIEGYHEPIYSSFSAKITDILSKTSFSQLSILWQIFSKGCSEVKTAHNQLIVTEMLTLKAIYSQILPKPEELLSASTVLPEFQQPILADNQQLPPDNTRTIRDFLKYLHSGNEIEIYYLLLNKVEIKKFTDNIIEIAGENFNSQLQAKIADSLFAWTAQKWDVIITKQSEISTLKEQLTNEFKSGQDWQLVKEHFPEVSIADVLLKT